MVGFIFGIICLIAGIVASVYFVLGLIFLSQTR